MYLSKACSKVCIRYNLSDPFLNDMPLCVFGLELKIGRVQDDHEARGKRRHQCLVRLDFSLSGEHIYDKAKRANSGRRPKGDDLEAPSRTVH
jgi:hypothetical protein